jgi:hypothetical protein
VLALRRTRIVHSIPELFRALQRSDALGKVLAETRQIRQGQAWKRIEWIDVDSGFMRLQGL